MRPRNLNVQCLRCYTVLAAQLIFEAFFREAFPFQRHLAVLQAFGELMFLLEPKGRGEKAV
jgi:hypothetical protein